MTAADFCEATAGQQINFRNAKFVVCLPWMAKAILGQSSLDPAAVAQVIKDAHGVFWASLDAKETLTMRNRKKL